MATHKGSEGTVKVGSNAIAEIRSYSLEENADVIEDTSMGDSARTYLASLTTFSGSVDVFWDETDTNGQGALTVGSSVTLNVYPEGSTSGDTYYSGTALVTGVTRSASFDGMVEASISVQGTGALTAATV
jgi:predicted secreted protein|tara:strand:+ start:1566 stop:1955 length:390 start_codon:yes stop_codon:yes gene_type:complete